MEESRKQFEAWFHSRYDQISMPPVERSMLFTNQWVSWQASRAVIEIELPKYHDYTNQDTTRAQAEKSAYNSGVYDSANAIRAAGIKVKE